MKYCPKCQQCRPHEEFCNNPRYKDGLNTWCRACCARGHKDWLCRNRQKANISAHAYRLQKLYGLSPQAFQVLLASQAGKCAICVSPLIVNGLLSEKKFNVHVDHDHETGLVRGILCLNCNAALGFLKDSVELAERAATYLRQAAGRKAA